MKTLSADRGGLEYSVGGSPRLMVLGDCNIHAEALILGVVPVHLCGCYDNHVCHNSFLQVRHWIWYLVK